MATRDWLTALATDPTHIWGQAAAALLHHHENTDLPPLPLHDPLAAVLMIEPQLATYDHYHVRVDLHQGTRGKTTADTTTTGPSVSVTTGVNVDAFRTRLLHTLSPT